MTEVRRRDRKPGLIFSARELDLQNLPRIDCHLHTSWTDGKFTVGEMYESALANNLSTVLYSEHCRKTSVDWFPRFAEEVRELPTSPCTAYVGAECKIESIDGSIDIGPAISDLCDFVMASVHRFVDDNGASIPFDVTPPDQAMELEFRLSWAALANPLVDILGHVFGMSYRRFKAQPSDDQIRALISRAAEFGVAVEINSHYHPDRRKMLTWCQELGAPVTFGSNAHTLDAVGAILRGLSHDS